MCLTVCRCEPVHGSGYGHMADGIGAGQAVHRFAASFTASRWCSLPQTANARSMRLAAKLGFTEAERFEAYGAEQWFGMWSPVTLSDEFASDSAGNGDSGAAR
jgi:hypothetical protein